MLAGVGGRTVEEAQQRMSYVEYLDWIAYRNRWGSFHQGMRIDRAVARVASMFAKNSKPEDFSPFDKAHSEPAAGTIDEAFQLLKGISRGT